VSLVVVSHFHSLSPTSNVNHTHAQTRTRNHDSSLIQLSNKKKQKTPLGIGLEHPALVDTSERPAIDEDHHDADDHDVAVHCRSLAAQPESTEPRQQAKVDQQRATATDRSLALLLLLLKHSRLESESQSAAAAAEVEGAASASDSDRGRAATAAAEEHSEEGLDGHASQRPRLESHGEECGRGSDSDAEREQEEEQAEGLLRSEDVERDHAADGGGELPATAAPSRDADERHLRAADRQQGLVRWRVTE
jgi:hypothetical protein